MKGIAVIMGGIALVYMAASGNLDSLWKGVKGECCGCRATDGSGKTGAIGEAAAAAGEAVSMRGYYYPSLGGQYYVSDAGIP